MRYHYVLLVIGGCVAFALMIEQAVLVRSLARQRQHLFQDQLLVANGPSFETAWKNLASGIYRIGGNDARLIEILQRNDIAIHVSAAPSRPAPFAVPTSAAPAPAGGPARNPSHTP